MTIFNTISILCIAFALVFLMKEQRLGYIALMVSIGFLLILLADEKPLIIAIEGNKYHFQNGNYAVIELSKNHENKGEYQLFSLHGDFLERGKYDKGNFISDNQLANPYLYSKAYFWGIFLIIELLLIVAYFIVFGPKDYIFLRDLYRNHKLIPITYMTMKEKESTLADLLWCYNGHEKTEQKIVEEVYKEGMHLIKLQCPTCKVILAERIS